jgi:hypothetical protein
MKMAILGKDNRKEIFNASSRKIIQLLEIGF